jgi:hypothetical protein
MVSTLRIAFLTGDKQLKSIVHRTLNRANPATSALERTCFCVEQKGRKRRKSKKKKEKSLCG